MGVRIRNTHKSSDGVLYKVEIYDADFAGTVLSYDDNGFEISWDGESDNFLDTIKSSSCTYRMFDDGSVQFGAFRDDLAAAQEDEFQLVVSKWNGSSYDLYWCGIIMTDMVQWRNENYPLEFEIIAKDGLNRINQIPFTNIDSSPFTTAPQTFMYIIERILAKNGLATYHSGDYIKVSADWYDTQMSNTSTQRVFERLRIWGDMFRKDISDDEVKTTNIDPVYCGDALKALLQLLCCRILYSEGAYHIQQVSNFIGTTYDVANYDNTGTYDSIDSSVSNRVTVDGTNLRILEGGMFGYHAAYKRCKLTARGYLDVRGAYIDNTELDKDNTSYSTTLQLGTVIGGVYATGSKTTGGNTNTFRALNAGTAGNSITLAWDGVSTVKQIVDNWNAANPSNQVLHLSGNPNNVHSAVPTTTLTGGDGDGNRVLEIDFDIDNFTQNQVLSSNIITTVTVKLICGSYRIKNKSGYTNTGVCEWSTTSTDKWTYTLYGYDINYKKLQIVTPEIPFAKETSCTCEITVTLTKKNGAAWNDPSDPNIWPQTHYDFFTTLRNLRVIAWDTDINTLSDADVYVDNPTNVQNSVEFDFGKILIGDNPVVQKSVSSKNYYEVYSSSSLWERPHIWSADFDTDYNLVTTMLMEAMALRKQPAEKYAGDFAGTYAAHKSMYYDDTTWVMNSLRFDSKMDTWSGVWFAIQYDQVNIVPTDEKLKPAKDIFGRPPFKPPFTSSKNDTPQSTDKKGTGAVPYTTGATINAYDVDALPKGQFMSGDKMMVYHPTTWEKLQEFVVDADTSVSDTSITVVSDTADADIPVGAVLQHDSREVVASDKGRFEQTVMMKSVWVNYRVINIDDSEGGATEQLTNEDYIVIVVPDGVAYSHSIYLPLISDSILHGKSIMIIVKNAYGAVAVYPHSSDSSARIWTNGTTGSLTSLNITAGNQRALITDGTHWHTISF